MHTSLMQARVDNTSQSRRSVHPDYAQMLMAGFSCRSFELQSNRPRPIHTSDISQSSTLLSPCTSQCPHSHMKVWAECCHWHSCRAARKCSKNSVGISLQLKPVLDVRCQKQCKGYAVAGYMVPAGCRH